MWTVGVVSEDPIVGHQLAALASSAPDTVVVLIATPGSDLHARLRRPPELLVVDDTAMRCHAIKALLRRPHRPKIVVVSSDPGRATEAVAARVDAVIGRGDAPVLPLVLTIVRGQLCVLPRAALDLALERRSVVVDVSADLLLARLTPRERQVLAHLMTGEHHAEIARSLEVSTHTIRCHVKQMLMKLQVHSTVEAALLGARAGLRPSAEALLEADVG